MKEKIWNVISDVDDNNFEPLVNQVINPETKEIRSFLITARAGAGKSYLIKQIQSKLDELKIGYFSVAPTNKACNLIGGETVNRFTNRISKNIKRFDSKVIILDEVSMLSEKFYKFFSTLKRIHPDVKFIICGDFNQLKAVQDRISEKTDYAGSPVVYELVDGNHIQLSKCRRSDNVMYNMCLPQNIAKLSQTLSSRRMSVKNSLQTNRENGQIEK